MSGSDAVIPAQMYRRFVTQVAVKPGRRLQFIVADNQLAAEYGREFTEIDFSYENPTVADCCASRPGADEGVE